MASGSYDLKDSLQQLRVSGVASIGVTLVEQIIRDPASPAHLLQALSAEFAANREASAASAPPYLQLLCQMLQKSCRRAPIGVCEGILVPLIHAVRESAALGWLTMLTQCGLAVSVLLLRTEAVPAAQVLSGLGSELRAEVLADRAALLAVLRLFAEELHAPAAKVTVSPMRRDAVVEALRLEAPALLAQLECWATPPAECARCAVAPLLATTTVLDCARAWCDAGLVSARLACESALLSNGSVRALGEARLAAHASELVCAALGMGCEPGESPAGGSPPPQQRRPRQKEGRPRGGAAAAAGGDPGGGAEGAAASDARMLPRYAASVHERLAELPLTLQTAAVVCQACVSLTTHLLRRGTELEDILRMHPAAESAAAASQPSTELGDQLGHAAAAAAATARVDIAEAHAGLQRYLPMLAAASCELSATDSAEAHNTWVVLQDLADGGADEARAAADTLLASMAPHRAPLLGAVLSSAGRLPADFEAMSEGERDDVLAAREAGRGLLRGAIFVNRDHDLLSISASFTYDGGHFSHRWTPRRRTPR